MTNNQIKYMIEVAETGSVNQAARNLYISQSALSNAIMSGEQEFGRKIFNRSSRGMTLTPFGKLFIAYITPIHQQLTQLYAMRNPAAAGSSTPTLNIISNGFYYISDIVAAIGRRNASQGLRISLQEEYGGNVTDALLNGSAELGVVRLWNCYRERNLETFANMKLLYHPVTELQVGVDVSWHSPLYKTEEEDIDPEALAPYPHIMHESLDFGPYADIPACGQHPVCGRFQSRHVRAAGRHRRIHSQLQKVFRQRPLPSRHPGPPVAVHPAAGLHHPLRNRLAGPGKPCALPRGPGICPHAERLSGTGYNSMRLPAFDFSCNGF